MSHAKTHSKVVKRRRAASSALRLTQPAAMRTRRYVYGVETVDGNDGWALFEACACGDVVGAKALLAKDRRLANAQFWYQFPIHMAVRRGNAELVSLLLDHGADPGQSRFTYDSWDKLLLCARDRGYGRVERVLERAMRKRFNYTPQFTVLKEAIMARDPRKISVIMRRSPELVRAADALGNTALHWSVITRQLGMIERFIDLGTLVDTRRADGQTPVLLAVNSAMDYWYRAGRGKSHPSLRNAWVMVGNLLAQGAEYTISVAAAAGDQERVEALLRGDPGLAARLDSSRVRPLSYAAREGHVHIVRLLLDHGADPNQPEDLAPDGRALFEACQANHFEVAKVLLDHGANPNAGVDSCGCCLTIVSVYHGRRARPLQLLLRQHGAIPPPYAMNARQMSEAIRGGHKVVRHEEFGDCVMRMHNRELLELYLEAEPDALNCLDFSSLVTIPGAPALIRKLLERGLDPNRTDWLGRTLLHACATHRARPVASVLLEAGGDINARELEFNATPLVLAVSGNDTDANAAKRKRQMVEFLLDHGAATNLPGDEPWATALAWAARGGHSEIVGLLKQHAAT
jgi:uncharacterized protein